MAKSLKSYARRNAWVTGVKAVDDTALKVVWWTPEEQQRDSTISMKSDEEVERAVRGAFSYDPRVFSLNPTVSVTNGTVTLTGVVGNLKAKQAAEQDARNTVGVWRVKNYLKVRPADPPSDPEVAKHIRQALLRSPYVNRFDIDVSVYNGTAYLTGDVDTAFEKSRAEEIASGIKGVVEVNNTISVRPVFVEKFDWEIEQDIKSELWWSPFVDADEVNVTVEDGVATLKGSVDTWSAISSAVKNAYEGGAVHVRNRLTMNGLAATS